MRQPAAKIAPRGELAFAADGRTLALVVGPRWFWSWFDVGSGRGFTLALVVVSRWPRGGRAG